MNVIGLLICLVFMCSSAESSGQSLRGSLCSQYGGRCVRRNKPCPVGRLCDMGAGPPLCRRRRRHCCYPCPASTTTMLQPRTPESVTTAPVGSCVCGRPNRATKIVNGTVTEVNEYPWQVALVNPGGNRVYCGGSLINNRWVLSAAHCTPVEQVLLGNHYQSQIDPAEMRVDIITYVIHPNYNSLTFDYDFSLLELATPLDLNAVAPNIAPICLPYAHPYSQYDDVLAIVTGWGTTFSDGPQSNTLQEVTVTTMTNAQCNISYDGGILSAMICAASLGKDSCQGDSGGPMATYDGDGYYNQIGVVSWGFGCAEAEYPGVYARVTSAIDWINSTSSSGQSCPPPS